MASRNEREGHYMGRAHGKAVRRYALFVPRPRSAFARSYRRGQLARQDARRRGVVLEIAHLADQQGAQ